MYPVYSLKYVCVYMITITLSIVMVCSGNPGPSGSQNFPIAFHTPISSLVYP